jgi:hypothetical protein
MFRGLKTLARKCTNILLALFIISAQLFAPINAFIPKAAAVNDCVVDTAGADDEPGQKDLNQLCVDDTAATSVDVTWNWDATGTSGANTLDACALFDTDNNGNINYAVCVTTTGDPAVEQSTTLYQCGDDKVDRCTSPVTTLAITNGTECSVAVTQSDPFHATGSNRFDAVADCVLILADVGGAEAELVDVCSYPSAQPNSDPSDCVIIQDRSGKIEVVKDLIPGTDTGKFSLQVNGVTKATDVGDGGSTGEVVVPEGSNSVGEIAGTGTNLSSYSTTISCRDLNGTGNVVASGSGTSLTLTVADGSDIICTITNTASGSITIVKDAIPNDAQDFAFTATGNGVSDFSLDDDANATLSDTRAFTGLAAGTYTFTEASVAGWYLANIECPNITETKDLTTGNVSLTITAGQNVTCTFTNRKLGQIVVTKQTNPNGDSQVFSITADGTNTISGAATRDIVDDETEIFTVRHGEYDVNEQDIAGWAEDDSACQNLVIDGNTPLVNGIPTRSCTITNTKLATLTIIKDALPDHEQNFSFTTTGLGGATFSLDDDSDNALSNQQVFNNLTPGQQYSVTEQPTSGWQLTGLSCNNVTQQGATATVTPTPGQSITCTFTNTKLRSIGGIKYTSNADSSLGPVLSGWTIFIDSNNNGVLDNGEASDVTEADGSYSFTDLLPGSYILKEVLLAGWTQIFGPATVNLTYNADSTGNNFGNFQNGSISGFKWNDRNANDVVDQGEEKMAGWTITLLSDGPDEDTDLDDQVAQTATAGVGGTYSFTNLAPGTYSVCETQQTGWVQTFPNSNGCHTIVINISGETNEANFGNQGRGTVRVIKNVDTDGDGDVDNQDVTTWTWDIDGGGNFATGSTNTQNVAAGTYTVSEDQQTNYHVTASSCSGETTPTTPSTSLSATVSAGENVTCTFTNTRDTGTITVNKVVNPTNDTGLFNLQINGQTAGTGANVGHGGTTGAVQIVTGTYNVGETAGTSTSLGNYTTSYSCVNSSQVVVASGSTTTSTDFSVSSGDTITCTITNTRYGKIIVQKETDPDGSSETFEFDTSYDITNFFLSDGQSNDSGNLVPGTYSVTEEAEAGWDLTSATCSDQSDPASINLGAGETVTCTFTNTQDANIVVVKQTDPDGDSQSFDFSASYDQNGFALSDGQSNDSGDLDPGTYTVSETVPTGWDLESVICSDGSLPSAISLQAGETVTCTFTNEKDAKIIVVKETEPDGSNQSFDFTASYNQSGFSLSDGQSNDSGDLDPGVYSVSETVPSNWDQTDVICDDGSDPGSINLSAGEVVTCTFTNVERGSITIIKDAEPNDPQDFSFTIEGLVPLLDSSDEAFDLDDDDDGTLSDTRIVSVRPGSYTISENQLVGWDLDDIDCGEDSFSRDGNSMTLNVSAGSDITCTFTNVKRAEVVVIKYNDLNQNGLQDVGEELLSNWEMSVNDTKQLTGQDGSTTFENLLPDEEYTVGETQQEGWTQTGISCSGNLGHAAVTTREDSAVEVFPGAGETVTCKIGNFKPAPAVLGAQTAVLADTGQTDLWKNMIIGMSLMTLALGTLLFPTRAKRASVVISLRRLER